jgi:hypothetical protein
LAGCEDQSRTQRERVNDALSLSHEYVKFDPNICRRYRSSIERAFERILDKGNEFHREMVAKMAESDLRIRVRPVSDLKASGVTGLINAVATNMKLATDRLTFIDALGEIYIAIAEETIDTGGQRGCEGTLVHEGRHAYDFAKTLESLSYADLRPLSVYNPTLYELELNAHKTAGDYMLCINEPEYIDEGLGLMILGRNEDASCFVDDEGICLRLRDSYGLALDSEQGRLATQMMGIVV